MKCPKCLQKHPHKNGMTCACGYKFGLDPKIDKMADGKFLAIMRKVSANDTQYFTTNQFHAERCRRAYFSITCGVIALLIALASLAVGLLVFKNDNTFFLVVAGAAGVIGVLLVLASLLNNGPSLSSTQELLAKWERKDGEIERLLKVPELDEPPPQWKEPDIYDYGVERILLVQRDLIVDLFVKNNFHSEQRTLVISVSGYPSYLAPVAAKLAQQREDLPVFVLHDASESAKQTIARAARLLDVPASRIVDMGITAADRKRMKSLRRVSKRGATVPLDYLTYQRMSELTAACFIGNFTYHQVIAQQLAGEGGSSFSFG